MSAASFRGRGSSQRARIREIGSRNVQPNFNQPRRDIHIPPAEFWLDNLPSVPWQQMNGLPPLPQPHQFSNYESHRYLRGRPQYCPGIGARGRSKRLRGEGRSRPGLLSASSFVGSEPSRFPPLGSEEERQQKIAETADKLKQKLSSLNVEEPVNFWEDDLSGVNFSQENEDQIIVASRGIPELRHDPPELNLTVNDFKDIGRVDPDNSFNSGDSSEILSSAKTQAAEENPVGPLTRLKIFHKNSDQDAKDVSSPRSTENIMERVADPGRNEPSGRDSQEVKAAIERLNYALACERKTSTPNPVEKEGELEVTTQKHKPELTKSLEKLREVIKVDREFEMEEKTRVQPNTGPRLQPDVRMDFHPGIGSQYPRFQSFNHSVGSHEIRNRIPPQFRNDHPAEISHFQNDFHISRSRNFNFPPIIHTEFNGPMPQRIMNRNADLQLPFDPREPPPRFHAPYHDDYHRNRTWYNRNELMQKFGPPASLNGLQQTAFNHRAPPPPPRRIINQDRELGNFVTPQEFPSQIVPMGYPHVPHIIPRQSGYFNPAMPPPNTAPCIIHKFPPPSVPHSSLSIDNNQAIYPPPIPTTPSEVRRPPSPPKLPRRANNHNHNSNVNDELDEMQEAFEFAKKFMNMTEKDDNNSPQLFNMPVSPGSPLVPSMETLLLGDELVGLKPADSKDQEKEIQDVGVDFNLSSKAAQVVDAKHSKSLVSMSEETKHRDNKNNAKVRASSSKGKTLLASTLESIWKEKVINRFLKMSKNDICNMVNSSGKRKNDIVMKHLVKEQKYSLSQERRCSADDAVKATSDISQEEEFISQLKAVLDPSATVDIKNLPAEFIQQLSEVLKLDVESHLNDSADFVENNNSLNSLVSHEAQSLSKFLGNSNIEMNQNLEINDKIELEMQPSHDFGPYLNHVDNVKNSPDVEEDSNEVMQNVLQREASEKNVARTNSHGFIQARSTRKPMSDDNEDTGDIFCAELTKPKVIDSGELWGRKKHPDMFRNLTREEFEAKELGNRSGTPSSSRETSVSARSMSPKYVEKNLESVNRSPPSLAKANTCEGDFIDNTTHDLMDSFSDCSSISGGTEESIAPNETKLLKVKGMSLQEPIGDEFFVRTERSKEKDSEIEMQKTNCKNQQNRSRKEGKKRQNAKQRRTNEIQLENPRRESFVDEKLIAETDNKRFIGIRGIATPLNKSMKTSSPAMVERVEETLFGILVQESNQVLPDPKELNTESFHKEAEKLSKDEETRGAVVPESPWGVFEAKETRKPSKNTRIKKIDIEAYKARKQQREVDKDDRLKEGEPGLNRESESAKRESPASENREEKKIPCAKLESGSRDEPKVTNDVMKKFEHRADTRSSNREKESRNHLRESKRSASKDDYRRSSKENSRHSSREKTHERIRSLSVDKLEQRTDKVVECKERKMEKNETPHTSDRISSTSGGEEARKENRCKKNPDTQKSSENSEVIVKVTSKLTTEKVSGKKEDTREKSPERKKNCEAEVTNEVIRTKKAATRDERIETNSEICEVEKVGKKIATNTKVMEGENPGSDENSNHCESMSSGREEETSEKLAIETTSSTNAPCNKTLERDTEENLSNREADVTQTERSSVSEFPARRTETSRYEAEADADVSNDVNTVLNDLIDKALSQLELLSNKTEAKETKIVIKKTESKENNVDKVDGEILIDNNAELELPETPEGPLKGFSEEMIKSSILGKRRLDRSVLEITEDYILDKKSKDFDDIMLDIMAESTAIAGGDKNETARNNVETTKVKIETEEVFGKESREEHFTKCVTPSGDTLSLGSNIDFDHNEFIVLSEISSDEDFSQDEDRKPILTCREQSAQGAPKLIDKNKVENNLAERSSKTRRKSTGIKIQRNKKESKNLTKTLAARDDVNRNTSELEKIVPQGTEALKKSAEADPANLIKKKSASLDENNDNKKRNSESNKMTKEVDSKIDRNLHRISHRHKTKHKTDKKWKVDGKSAKEIAKNEELVAVVEKRQTKEDVVARMVEIDLEVHKLMSEKMRLYKMLESGELSSHQNHAQPKNETDDNLSETLTNSRRDLHSRSSDTNESCKLSPKKKSSASKASLEPLFAKSTKISDEENQMKKPKKVIKCEESKKSTYSSAVSRGRITEDKSMAKKSARSDGRSGSNSGRREEETRERKERTDHQGCAKRKASKTADFKKDGLHRVKKEVIQRSGNEDAEQQHVYSDGCDQVYLSQDFKSSKKSGKGFASLGDSLKQEKTESKKHRIVVNRGRKERLKSDHKGANPSSALDEEMPLNLLLVKKSQRKKGGTKKLGNNNPKLKHAVSTSSLIDHVSETINAVAQNTTGECQRTKKIKVEIEPFCDDGRNNSHRKVKIGCKTNADSDFTLDVVWPFQNVESSKKLVENFSDDEFGDLLLDDFDNCDNGFPIDKIMEISRENNGADNNTKDKGKAVDTKPLSLFANFYNGDLGEKISCRQWNAECDSSKSHAFNYMEDIPRFDDSNSTFMPQDENSESHSISKNFKDIEKGLDVLDSMLETVDLEGISSKKDVKKNKRKRLDSDVNSNKTNTMTRLEMMSCSVRLVDCKYTYFKHTSLPKADQQCRIFNVVSLRRRSDETGMSGNLFSPQRSDGEDWLVGKDEITSENVMSINDEEYLNAECDMSRNNEEGNSAVYADNDVEMVKLQEGSESAAQSEAPSFMADVILSYPIAETENWESRTKGQPSNCPRMSPNCLTSEVCEVEAPNEPPRLRAKPFSKLVDKESGIKVVDNVIDGISVSEQNENKDNGENAENEQVESPRIQYSVHKGPILDVKVFGDSILAASEDGVIYRYSQTCNGILNTYEGHESAVTCIHVLQGVPTQGTIAKDLIFSGSLDGSLRCFDIMTNQQFRGAAEVGSPVQCMDQSWGVIFLGTKSGHVFRFNIKSHGFKGDEIRFSEESVLALKATTEGPRRVLIVASRSQPITIRDAQSGLFLRTVSGHKSHTVYSLLMDSNLVYCGTSGTAIPVFDFINGVQIKLYNAGPGIVCMRMYKWLLFAGCYDGNIYVFDTKEQRLICSIPGPGNMLLSMDVVENKIVAGSKDRRLHIWQMPEQVLTILAAKT